MPPTPSWMSVLGILQLKYIIAVLCIMGSFSSCYLGFNAASQEGLTRNSRHGESTSSRGAELNQPPKPVLPENIDIASISFIGYEGDARAPRLDLKLTNMGSRPAFITKVQVNVKRTWRLRELPTTPGVVVPPGHNYVIKLKPNDQPYQVILDVSEGIKPDDFGRFSLQFEEDPWVESHTIYFVDVELVANSDQTTYKTQNLLFLITQRGILFPTQQDLDEVTAGAKSMGQKLDVQAIHGALAENKRIIMEAEKTKAVMNPSLRKLIESAKASPLGKR